jgi:hypothetical protein
LIETGFLSLLIPYCAAISQFQPHYDIADIFTPPPLTADFRFLRRHYAFAFILFHFRLLIISFSLRHYAAATPHDDIDAAACRHIYRRFFSVFFQILSHCHFGFLSAISPAPPDIAFDYYFSY